MMHRLTACRKGVCQWPSKRQLLSVISQWLTTALSNRTGSHPTGTFIHTHANKESYVLLWLATLYQSKKKRWLQEGKHVNMNSNFGERTTGVGNTTLQDLTFNQFTSIVTSEILGSRLTNKVH
jgi:hypothetical protein